MELTEDVKDIEETSKTMKMFLDLYAKIDTIYSHKRGEFMWGYKTKLNEYDDITQGLSNSELTVVAGRHSMGKTSFLLNIAVNLAEQEIPVLYVSYDLDKNNLTNWILSIVSEVDGNKIKQGFLQSKEWNKVAKGLEIIDKSLANYLQLEPNCYLYYKDLFNLIREFKNQHSDGVVIVDYFQLIKLSKKDDTRIIELSNLAAAFKNLAMEIEMPILLASQVNKKCEDRQDKRPQLSDLAECDALAQHCDNLIFLYRDDYYYSNKNEDDYDFQYNKIGSAEIIIAKQKNGELGTVELLFQKSIYKFKNPLKTESF